MNGPRPVAAYITYCGDQQILTHIAQALNIAPFVVSLYVEPGWTIYRSGEQVVIIQYNMEKIECCEIWLSEQSRWADDIEFARFLSNVLTIMVYCDPESHYPETANISDILLKIEGSEEHLVKIR